MLLNRNISQRWPAQEVEPTIKSTKPATKIDMEALRRDVEQYHTYQYERVQRLGTSQKGIFAALKRLGVKA